MTATTATLATPDLADELAAGRPYPVRDWQQPQDSDTARELLLDLRTWWLDAAQGYLDVAELATRNGEPAGAAEALADSRTALAAAGHYAPAAGAAGVNAATTAAAHGLTVTGRTAGRATSAVTLAGVTRQDDPVLATVAGYSARHFGYSVTRHPEDGTATVHLWND